MTIAQKVAELMRDPAFWGKVLERVISGLCIAAVLLMLGVTL